MGKISPAVPLRIVPSGKKNCKILTNHPHLLSEDGQIAWVGRSCVVRRASWVVGCELRANNESKRSSRHAIIEQELSFLTYDLKCRGGSRGRVQGVRTPPPPCPEITCSFLIQLVFCKKKKLVYWCWSQERETSAPPPKRNPGSAPEMFCPLRGKEYRSHGIISY